MGETVTTLVTLSFPGYWEGRTRVIAGLHPVGVQLRSPYLVSAGQLIDIQVAAQAVAVLKADPGDRLIDARQLCHSSGRIQVLPTHNYEYIPSARPLWDILADVVQHGVEWPSHGIDCVCMDKFSYEIKHHILRATPKRTEDTYQNTDEWESHYRARMRIKHVLRMASNIL